MTPQRLAPMLGATLMLASLALARPTTGQDRPLAFTGATIETVAEAGRIEPGVVVLREGVIEAVGPMGEVEIPDDARVVDASGLTLMPGIVEPAFSARGSAGGGSATVVIGDQVVTISGSSPSRTPSFARAVDLFDPYRSDFTPLLRSGLTQLNLLPPDYGQAAVVRILEDEPGSSVVEGEGRLYLSVSNSTPSLELLRRSLQAARRPAQQGRGRPGPGPAGNAGAGSGQDRGPAPGRPGGQAAPGPQDRSRELWRAVVEGKAPLIADAGNAAAILYLLDAIDEFKDLQLVLVASGREVYQTIDRLADRGSVTLLLRPTIDTKVENRDRINVPRIVHERGLPFAFTQGGSRAALRSGQDAPLFDVGYLIATGLPREVALEALTSRPAELIGLGDSLGRIEAGKSASLLIFDGDPFDPYSRLRTVINEGRTVYESD